MSDRDPRARVGLVAGVGGWADIPGDYTYRTPKIDAHGRLSYFFGQRGSWYTRVSDPGSGAGTRISDPGKVTGSIHSIIKAYDVFVGR